MIARRAAIYIHRPQSASSSSRHGLQCNLSCTAQMRSLQYAKCSHKLRQKSPFSLFRAGVLRSLVHRGHVPHEYAEPWQDNGKVVHQFHSYHAAIIQAWDWVNMGDHMLNDMGCKFEVKVHNIMHGTEQRQRHQWLVHDTWPIPYWLMLYYSISVVTY